MTIAEQPPACEISATPQPKVPHAVVCREDVKSHVLIIGDIHGCATEFRSLVETVAQSLERMPTIVCVGDLVNKGPYSGEVVSLARKYNALCVRGNHDDDLLAARYRVGRFRESLNEYHHNALNELSEDDIQWLQECPLTIAFPWLNLAVVHAGVVPGVKLEDQCRRDLMWMRDVVEERGQWAPLEEGCEGSIPWASVWEGPEFVVFGHDAKRELQVYPYAIGLDTGCCYGKKLSALLINADNLEDRIVVNVPAQEVYSEPKTKSISLACSTVLSRESEMLNANVGCQLVSSSHRISDGD